MATERAISRNLILKIGVYKLVLKSLKSEALHLKRNTVLLILVHGIFSEARSVALFDTSA